jgi:hypothetical protein
MATTSITTASKNVIPKSGDCTASLHVAIVGHGSGESKPSLQKKP